MMVLWKRILSRIVVFLCMVLVLVNAFNITRPVSASDPEPLADRLVFVALTPAIGDPTMTPALNVALDAGADGPGDINLEWGALEPATGHYTDPEGTLAWARANLRGRPVHLTLAPLQTTFITVPPDLEGVIWDDPVMITRFQAVMDYVAGELEGVPILTVAIGNEVDLVLGSDQVGWDTYCTFFTAVLPHARTLWPDAQIGVKLSFEHLIQNVPNQTRRLITLSDAVLATYYPDVVPVDQLDQVIHSDFEALVAVAGGKPMHIVEIGYPSSPELGSSENDQAVFISAVFSTWDIYSNEIPSLSFAWLHDLAPEWVQVITGVYGADLPQMAAFFGSLGLRTPQGEDKPSFTRFRLEVAARR